MKTKATPVEQQEQSQILESIVKQPYHMAWDNPDFEKTYRSYKTGVPIKDALEFGAMLVALVEGRHVGQKFLRRFCNDGNATTPNVWIYEIIMKICAGTRQVEIALGERGVKVCDALFGKGRGPIKQKLPGIPQGFHSWEYRIFPSDEETESGIDNHIHSDSVSIKSGYEHFQH